MRLNQQGLPTLMGVIVNKQPIVDLKLAPQMCVNQLVEELQT